MHAKFMHKLLMHIFQHIMMLLDLIIIFCIDLLGFSIDPPYFGYNSAEQENPVLHILIFEEPSRTQIDPRFFGRSYFITKSIWYTRSQQGGPRGPKEHRWRGPLAWPRHTGSFGPWTSAGSIFIADCLA
jgi:hypothetical protein